MRQLAMMALMALMAASKAAAAGDVVILESTAPQVAVGDVIDEAHPVVIPAGASVSMIMSDGETRLVEGPYEGPLAAAVGEAGGAAAALSSSRGGDTRVLGAVRAPSWEIDE